MMKLLEVKKGTLHLEFFAKVNYFLKTEEIPTGYLVSKYFTVYKVSNGRKAKENSPNTESMFNDIVLKILKREDDIDVLFMHKNVRQFLDTYSETTKVGENITLPIYQVNRVDERLQAYTLDFATDVFAYYSIKDQLLVASNDGMIKTQNPLFASVYLLDSLKAIRSGSEKLLYGEVQNYEEEFADELYMRDNPLQ